MLLHVFYSYCISVDIACLYITRFCLFVWYEATKRILGECLLISSLPGNALRTLVDIARLAERFNMRSQS